MRHVTLKDVNMSLEGGTLPLQCTMLASEGVMTLSESGRNVLYLPKTAWWPCRAASYFRGAHHVLKGGK